MVLKILTDRTLGRYDEILKRYIDEILPEKPASGNYGLACIDGEMVWVESADNVEY